MASGTAQKVTIRLSVATPVASTTAIFSVRAIDASTTGASERRISALAWRSRSTR